jgi:hypothetical protein
MTAFGIQAKLANFAPLEKPLGREFHTPPLPKSVCNVYSRDSLSSKSKIKHEGEPFWYFH